MSGADLFRMEGLKAETVLRLVSEEGLEVSGFASQKQFASWLSLSRDRRVSGGKVLSSKTKASKNRAAGAFRQAAASVGRSDSESGACYGKMQGREGPGAAVTATAHELARIYYNLDKNGRE